MNLFRPVCLVLIASVTLPGCSTNPVTGANEFSIVSEQQELAIGAQQYSPARQSQGGDFTADESLSRYVNQVGQRLAAVSDRDLPYEFTVLNNGVPNAWALPGGKIAVNRGLLVELNSEAELAAVLGHEIVHAAARHGAQMVTRGTLLQGALIASAVASSDSEYSNLIVGGAQLGAQLISQSYGREAEREADLYGIRYMVAAGYDPMAAVTLQQTFVRLSEGRSSGWLEGLFSSHPPSQERVDNNRALVNQMQAEIAGRNLELGEDRYRQETAFLRQSQPAYALMDEAEEDINDDDLESAMNKLRRASEQVPTEARFIGLQADILLYQRRYRESITTYNRAVALDSNYFDYYLGRGVAYSRTNARAEARRDLERSAELLPTAIAANELGKLSLAAGNRNQAKQYFQLAASGEGAVSAEARQAFIQLDRVDNPRTYLQAEPVLGDNRRLFARVVNQSGADMVNVVVNFNAAVADQSGEVNQTIGFLPAGATVDVDSGENLPAGTIHRLTVTITRATPR
ncbi:MAG: M48 family metalloprotease [Pseudohongiellaceae bacterium]